MKTVIKAKLSKSQRRGFDWESESARVLVPDGLSPKSEDQIRIVMGWNLERVKSYLINRGGFAPEKVDRLEIEYKRFIALNVLFPGVSIPIAGIVDEMWHTHILFTEDYRDFCESIQGGFIDHFPTCSESEAQKLLGDFRQNTLELYKRVFGPPDMRIWKHCVCMCDR